MFLISSKLPQSILGFEKLPSHESVAVDNNAKEVHSNLLVQLPPALFWHLTSSCPESHQHSKACRALLQQADHPLHHFTPCILSPAWLHTQRQGAHHSNGHLHASVQERPQLLIAQRVVLDCMILQNCSSTLETHDLSCASILAFAEWPWNKVLIVDAGRPGVPE